MAKKYIITKKQLNEYVERKRTEKVFYDILLEMHKSGKFLNENVSRNKVNQTIINNYRRKELVTPQVYEMLVKYGVINENYEII
jgi:hypothetical protein